MTDDPTPAAEPTTTRRFGGVLWAAIWGGIGLVCGAGGFAIPMLFPGLFSGTSSDARQVSQDSMASNVKTTYIDFGEIVVNINSDRLNRYLRVHLTLQVKLTDKLMIEKIVAENRAMLKSWLISYLSDVSMDDIRGAAGQNRLRREIQDHFNSVLFSDGFDRIREVLFEEFNVQ